MPSAPSQKSLVEEKRRFVVEAYINDKYDQMIRKLEAMKPVDNADAADMEMKEFADWYKARQAERR